MKLKKPVRVHICKIRNHWWMHYTINGSRVRKSCGTKLRGVAQDRAREVEEDLNNGCQSQDRQQISLDEFFTEFIQFSTSEKRPRTVDTEIKVWNRFAKWLKKIRVEYVDEINEFLFRKYKQHLQKNGLSKVTVNIAHRHLSSILTFAVKMNYSLENPIRNVEKYKVPANVPKYLSAEQIGIIMTLAENHSPQMHMIFALGIYGGLRRNEIANARWEWFDFENDTITIQPFEDFIPKNHRTRPIPLHQTLRKILEKYKLNEGYLFESDITRFAENNRKNMIRYDFKKSFRTVTKKAGLEWVTPHILRHTFASQLAKAGVSLYKIQQWLGHSDPKTTMIYAHLQAQDDEINKIP